MRDFEIKLDGKEYKCSSTSSNSKGDFSWTVNFNHGNVRTQIHIPMENKVTRAKVILFIEAFHEGMKTAFDAQKLDQNYIWNHKETMNL